MSIIDDEKRLLSQTARLATALEERTGLDPEVCLQAAATLTAGDVVSEVLANRLDRIGDKIYELD